MSKFRIELPLTELNLPLCVSCGQVFRWRETQPGTWVGVDGDCWFRATQAPSGWDVESNGTEADFARLFQLNRRVADVEAQVLTVAPNLAQAVAGLPGLRLMRPAAPHEVLFCFMCTPNNHLSRITSMVRHLDSFGEEMGPQGLRRFPSVERISEIPEEDLRGAGFGYRGATIPSAARSVLERGDGWLEGLKAEPYPVAQRALMELPGIGPKVADCICLFGLQHNHAAPVDTHLWQAACREYFPEWAGCSVTAQRYKAVGDKLRDLFGDLTGWAHQYLFYDNLLRHRARASKPPGK